jgi:hypothetical protein
MQFKHLQEYSQNIFNNYSILKIDENYKNALKYQIMLSQIEQCLKELKKRELQLLNQHFLNDNPYVYCGYSKANYYKRLRMSMERMVKKCKMYTTLIK